jgi:hypothetical protein
MDGSVCRYVWVTAGCISHLHPVMYGLGGRLVYYSGLLPPIQSPGEFACPYSSSYSVPSKRRSSSIPLLQQLVCLATPVLAAAPFSSEPPPLTKGQNLGRLFSSFPSHQASEQPIPEPPGQRWEG